MAPRTATLARYFSSKKITAPPMVYISGEEMTRYCMELIMDKWIEPRIDTSSWEFFDLSCKSRDDSEDKVLHDAVAAGKKIGAIFKEPTVTPTEVQKKKLGLRKSWGSPNGAMRRGWNGITISRDTIHIDGMKLGYAKPVLFERHAVGGEYSAGYDIVGAGRVVTIYHPDDNSAPHIIDSRTVKDSANAVVTYDNPLDNVIDLAHHFFSRCLEAGVTPYVVTKKTVFKWQEGFWTRMKDVFDEHYAADFKAKGLVTGELQHLISDAATMQLVRWTDGGFGMAAHNYDGDMLTDEVAQIHRSPGFITSNLIGKNDDGTMIKEFEASHGTVADMWDAHQRGEPTSLNPLGMVEALIGAMNHAAALQGGDTDLEAFTSKLRKSIHKSFALGYGTKDLCGESGLSTESFVEHISALLDAPDLDAYLEGLESTDEEEMPLPVSVAKDLDEEKARELFIDLDKNNDGVIDFDEFKNFLVRYRLHPKKIQEED